MINAIIISPPIVTIAKNSMSAAILEILALRTVLAIKFASAGVASP